MISENEVLSRSLFILIGAGASFGHSINRSCCPPLGKDLGSRLREEYSEFRDVEERCGLECGEDFEEWLEKFSNRPEEFTDVLWRISKFLQVIIFYRIVPRT